MVFGFCILGANFQTTKPVGQFMILEIYDSNINDIGISLPPKCHLSLLLGWYKIVAEQNRIRLEHPFLIRLK